MEGVECESVAFVTRSTGQQEDLQHRERQVVIVLACRGEFQSVLSKLGSQHFEVLAGILTWEPHLDRRLEVLVPLNRCRLNRLEELKPDDWKWVCFL